MKYLQLKFQDKEAAIFEDWARSQGSNFTVEARKLIINKIREIKDSDNTN
jgi:hypothetical protein